MRFELTSVAAVESLMVVVVDGTVLNLDSSGP